MARLAPGPAGNILESALHQASRTSGTTALVAGAASALVSGTLAMAQMERGANRLYGMEADRTAIRRFSHAFAMNLTAGILLPATQLSSAPRA